MVQAATRRDLAELLSTGREITPQQTRLAEQLLHPRFPKIGTRSQPLQNSRDVLGNPRFAIAAQAAREVHQQQITAQRKILQHPLARTFTPEVLQGTKPMRLGL